MKKIFTLMALIAGVSMLLGTNRHVGSGQTYSTIYAAYSAAQNGDTIVIHPGTYICCLFINKTINITSSEDDPTRVQLHYPGSNMGGEYVFDFHRDFGDCSVSNLTIRDSDGGIAITATGCTIRVDNCIIKNNTELGIAGSFESDIEVNNCIIRNNTYYGISSNSAIVTNTLFHDNGCIADDSAALMVDEGAVTNCTIVNNARGILTSTPQLYPGPTIVNSIIYDNEYLQMADCFARVYFCCVEGGYEGEGNISADPQFTDPSNNDFSLQWDETGISPLIDAGDPNAATDPDGTRADIGAFRAPEHTNEIYTLNTGHSTPTLPYYNWVCFPVIDNHYTAENDLEDFMQPLHNTMFDFWYQQGQASHPYASVFHYPNAPDVTPKQGYKIAMCSTTSMTKSGFLADENTEIELSVGVNWVGYFIETSQYPLQALSGILDNINQIKHRDWCATEVVEGKWSNGAGYTINYGDMVEITCTTPCSFTWVDNLSRNSAHYKSRPVFYKVVDTPDYTPVYVNLGSLGETLPLEVAIYANGELIGASVVDDTTTQVNAYMNDLVENKDIQVTFELYYGSECSQIRFENYFAKAGDAGEFTGTNHLFETPARYYQVILGEGDENQTVPSAPFTASVSNYPNPFNPETTISYSLPQEGLASVRIYNARGQLVRTLVNETMQAGTHEVVWTGRDDNNQSVASGIYMLRMQTGDTTVTLKLLLLK